MDDDKRLIPYSVYLRRDIHAKLKEAAQDRKAASLVRDAVTMMIEGEDAFNAGYNKALRDAIEMVKEHPLASSIVVNKESVGNQLAEALDDMIVIQNTNKVTHAKKKV